MITTIGYLKARLTEKGTWAAIGAGVTAAAALASPFNLAFIAIAVISALVPTP